MGLFSSSLSSVRKRFIDIFSSRSNTAGSLGTASDGSQWEAVSKVIEVQDGKAVANYVPQPADGGSEYPIAVVNMPTQNNIITLEDTDVGSGVALWVQTSSDWWMVSADSSYVTIPASTNYTSGPTAFSGQQFFSVSTNYTSSIDGFTSANSYFAGPITYSPAGDVYSSGATVYTRSPATYTSSLGTYTRGTTWTSAFLTTYTRNDTYTRVYAFGPNPRYSITGIFYTRRGTAPRFTFTRSTRYASQNFWTLQAFYTRNTTYAQRKSYTGGSFYTSALPTYFSNTVYTSGNPFSSTPTYSSSIAFTSNINYTSSQSYFSLMTYTLTDQYSSSIAYTSSFQPESFSYSSMLKIYQSINNVVSEISSLTVSTAQTIKSIIVQAIGNQITAKAFSDVDSVTQIGNDLTHNATGAIINTKYGISITKAEYSNSEIGASVKIERG